MTRFAGLMTFMAIGLVLQVTDVWALNLSGHLTQGGLIRGKVEPGTKLEIDGRPVRVGPAGQFVIGFGREAVARSELKITHPNGGQEISELNIEPRVFPVQRIDGLPQKMVTPSETVLKRITEDNIKIAEARKTDSDEQGVWGPFLRPADGPISGIYGSQRILNGEPRQPHYGLDIAGPRGADVRAPADGVVTLAEPDMYYTGATIIIDHGFGLSSVLMHLEDFSVRVGDRVKAGEVIARLGASGRATGPHLDWRVNWYDVRVDPALLLETGAVPSQAQNP